MNDKRFERHLQDQPLRPLPAAWRAEILTAASAATPCRLEPKTAATESWWRGLLWPSPVAWAGVAAAWLMIVGLNNLTPGPTSTVAVSRGAGVFDLPAILAMQRLLEPDQFDSPAYHQPEPPKPGPRQRPRTSRVAPHNTFCV